MRKQTGKPDNVARRRPSLRLAVVGAGLLIAASILPLIWRATHTIQACMVVTESYLKGEALRDHAFHLNDAIAHDAVTAIHQPELFDIERRELLVAQLRDGLLIGKLLRQRCASKCALDRADSLQTVMRTQEAAAIALGLDNRPQDALGLLGTPGYHAAAQEFIAALDTYAHEFKADMRGVVVSESREERLALLWVGLIFLISILLWMMLLRSVESWKKRVTQEVEERDRAQRDLNRSLQRYRDLFDQVDEAIFLADARSGRILAANPAASELLGYEGDELTSLHLADFDTGPSQWAAGSATGSDDQSRRSLVERRYRRKDRGTLTVEVSRRLVHDRGQERLLYLARDITQRRALEDQLAHAQQMECVGRLAAGIAHDLGNTLLAVSAQTLMLRQTLDPAVTERGAVDHIEASVEQAASVVKSLLSLADHSVATPRRVDSRAVFGQAVEFLKPVLPAAIELVVAPLPDRPAWIHVDPDRLHQAMLNLALNACDAMPDGGRLTMSLVCSGPPSGGPPTAVEFVVSDTGSGVPPEIRDQLGQPFVTTKRSTGGVGLGLFNVWQIATECGGSLQVSSTVERGATFAVSVPLLAVSFRREALPAGCRVQSCQIMLANDNAFAREVIAEGLRAVGHQVTDVATSAELREFLDRAAFDLVIVDSELDDGEGIDCAVEVQQRPDPPPVLLTTGQPLHMVEAQVPASTLILARPYTMQVLCRLANAAMKSPVPWQEVES